MRVDETLPSMGSDASEPFVLLECLGIGGFAHTYRARVVDEDLARDFGSEEVALKIPRDRKKMLALRRDVETNAALHLRLKEMDWQHIARYLGFWTFRGQIVVAFEYVPQGSLRRIVGEIDRQKRLPPHEAVKVAQGVLKGLVVLHGEHIFHRDIKPENILMQGRRPKIADFGISRLLAHDELASTTTGTIFYMAPELLGSQGASFPADIWSLGVTLYEMLTGRLPFGNGETPIGTMADLIRTAAPIPPHEVCPDIPQPLSRLLMRALSKEPGERNTAESMCQALEHWLRGPDYDFDRELGAIQGLIQDTGCSSGIMEAKLRQLVAKHPTNPRAYQYLGEFYNRCQSYSQAVEVFRRGLQRTPDDAILHWDLGLALFQSNPQEAARHLEKAKSLNLDASLRRHADTLLKALQKRNGRAGARSGRDQDSG